jgi:hypothetical protein
VAYSKTVWKDRVVQNPLTYTLQSNGDGTTTLIPAEGAITEPGTALTAAALNNLESQYEEVLEITNTLAPLAGAKDIALNVRTDFGCIGDGVSDDTVKFQAALDAVSDRMNIVFVPGGTYNLTATVYIKSNTRLILAPNAILKRAAATSAIIVNRMDNVGLYGDSENIEISGGTFDLNQSAFPTAAGGIAIGHANNVKVIGATFKNIFDWHFIEYNSCSNSQIISCFFLDYNGNGGGSESVQLDCAGAQGWFPFPGFKLDNTPCKNIKVEKCVFLNGTKGVGTHSAVNYVTHMDITIRDCHFENLTGEAISPYSWGRAVIENNTILNCGYGIVATAPYQAVNNYRIRDNNLSNITNRGIQIKGNAQEGAISGNFLDTCGTHGITVDAPNKNWIIDNNTVKNCGNSGIWSYGALDVVISRNYAWGNNTAGGASYDIMVGYATGTSSNTKVTDNTCVTMAIGAATRTFVLNNLIGTFTQGGDVTVLIKKNNIVNGAIDA